MTFKEHHIIYLSIYIYPQDHRENSTLKAIFVSVPAKQKSMTRMAIMSVKSPKYQTIAFIKDAGDYLPFLPTDFISFQ
jgi:hypothetical protein